MYSLSLFLPSSSIYDSTEIQGHTIFTGQGCSDIGNHFGFFGCIVYTGKNNLTKSSGLTDLIYQNINSYFRGIRFKMRKNKRVNVTVDILRWRQSDSTLEGSLYESRLNYDLGIPGCHNDLY